MNPFALPQDAYKRQMNPLGQYKQQLATFLKTMTGQSDEVCRQFVEEEIKRGKHGIRDPRIKYLARDDSGDRATQEGTLMEYIQASLQEGEVIAPTLTTYTNPVVKESVLVQYVEDNIAMRNRAKKEQFVARTEGNKDLEAFKNKEQTGTKLNNNAVSGAHASPSTPLYNKTAHSSLTSNCRITSGYGNANNEKMCSGNRHYWSPHIVLNNVVSIIDNTDYAHLQSVMDRYQLHVPTVEETLSVIAYSSDVYWRNGRAWSSVKMLVGKLTGLQRAAFVYTGDLYHIKRFNDQFMREFITKLSTKVMSASYPDPLKALHENREDNINLAAQICADDMKGKGKNYKELAEKHPEIMQRLTGTACNVTQVVALYADFIKAFFVTENVPASVAYIKDSIRHAALTSDTDSTIFTVQDWVQWHQGKLRVEQSTVAVGAAVVFLASQAIVHVLARMSSNLGVNPARVFQTAMKNEFYFPVFVPTNVGKHYFANISAQEGNILEEYDIEIKGVHLKSSNAPKEITARAKAMMIEILDTAAAGEKISLTKYLKEIADKQREIKHSLLSGDVKYYRLGEIKSAAAYKDPAKSQYVFYDMWERAFAQKYPTALQLPYATIKISTTLQSAVLTKQWVERLEDKKMAEGINAWMASTQKINIPTIQIPLDAVRSYGIPTELVEFVDARRIIGDITQIFVLLMETLGFYLPKGVMFFDLY